MRDQPAPARTDAPQLLAPMLSSGEALRAEYRYRRDQFEYTSVHPADEEQYIAKGWQLHQQGKTKLKLKRLKVHSALLEDRVWSLLFRMGYPVISGRNFTIKYRRADNTEGKKQLDVFAKDDETCLVVECKSREVRGKRSLQKDLHETDALKKSLADAVRKQFGIGYKPKIIWLYVTSNIIWTEQDAERAAAANIRTITENELQYFEAFVAHIGPAGRYQFLAEFLHGQDIPQLSSVRVPAVRGSFGKHTFYSFAVSPRRLLKIAFVNHQALNHPDGRPAYQRMINRSRIKKIGAFISKGGFFPTNILVNFTDKCRFDLLPNDVNSESGLKFGWLYLPNRYKSAWVIDGQHRLYGYSNLSDKFLDQTLFVLAFERMDTKTEADLFITINHEQKSVPKSLLIALQADLKIGSDDPREAISALSSALVKSISVDPTSPFFGRFTIPGIAPSEGQNLTIPEAVKGLVRSTLLGRALPNKTIVPGYLVGETDPKTLVRARRILNGYFRAIMDAQPERWRQGRSAFICVNPSIRAHFQLIHEIIKYLEAKESLDPHTSSEDELAKKLVTFVDPILEFVRTATDSQIEKRFARKFGEGGVAEYLYNLSELLLSKHADFGSAEFHAYRARRTDARIEQASQDVLDLQEIVSNVVVDTLKRVHGTQERRSGEKAFWEVGIEDSKIKQNAYAKQQMDPIERRAPVEAYLDFIDLLKIVKQQNNWQHFEPVLNMQMPDERAGKKYYLDWLEKLNDLRKIAAHKTAMRNYEPSDYDFLEWLKSELYPRLEKSGFNP